MKIIRATAAEAAVLSAIAQAAKAHWGYPPRLLEQWREQLTITSQFIDRNETFAAFIENQPVGFHALVEQPDAMSLEHLWVLPEQIGRGIGRALFQHAVERATARGGTRLTIEADPHAEPFYRHMGARNVGVITRNLDGLPRELPLLVFDLTKSRSF